MVLSCPSSHLLKDFQDLLNTARNVVTYLFRSFLTTHFLVHRTAFGSQPPQAPSPLQALAHTSHLAWNRLSPHSFPGKTLTHPLILSSDIIFFKTLSLTLVSLLPGGTFKFSSSVLAQYIKKNHSNWTYHTVLYIVEVADLKEEMKSSCLWTTVSYSALHIADTKKHVC